MTVDEWFDDFWSKCPKRVEKFAARTAYDRAVKLAAPEAINAGMERYARERSGQDPQYTKYPATWLNKGCWADEEGANAKQTYISQSAAHIGGNIVPMGFYAREGSPELEAWDKHYRMTRGVPAPRDSGFGFRFPTRWPPDGQRTHPAADHGDHGRDRAADDRTDSGRGGPASA